MCTNWCYYTNGNIKVIRIFWEFIFLLTIIVFIFEATTRGYIPIWLAVLIIAIFTIIRATIGIKRGLSRVVRTTFKIGIPITILIIFAITISKGDFRNISGNIFTIIIFTLVLAVIINLFRGFCGNKK